MGTARKQAVSVVIEPMRIRDVAGVLEVEKKSFPSPWTGAAFLSELLNNERAYYLVARPTSPGRKPRVAGYIGVWLIVDEGHITNVAVHPEYRRQGLGRQLMLAIEGWCKEQGATSMTLEVRVSNIAAQTLYEQLGYVRSGIRPGYYRDNNEDAFIMWKEL